MKQCPKCKISWESEAEIPDDLIRAGHYTTKVEAEMGARNYGWTTKNGKRFPVNHNDIQMDGKAGVRCIKCGEFQSIWRAAMRRC